MFHALTVSLIKLAFKILGLVFLFAGLAAVQPLWLLSAEGQLQSVRTLALSVTAVCLPAGVALLWLRTGRLGLPDERDDSPNDASLLPLGGWLQALALSLAVTPLALLLWLEPLGSLWRLTHQILERADFWGAVQRSQEFSGLLIIPVLAGLLVPLAETATAASFGMASVMLVSLMAWRSRFFPRVFMMCLVIQGTLLMLTFFAIDFDLPGTARRLSEPELREVPDSEAAAVLKWLELHETVARRTAVTLAYAFGAYLIWLPAVLRSDRIHQTFTRTPRWPSSWLAIGDRLRHSPALGRRIVTRIVLDGKTYSSLDELPPEVRARLEHATPIEQSSQVYRSLEELPPEIRERFPDLDGKHPREMSWVEKRPKVPPAPDDRTRPGTFGATAPPTVLTTYSIKAPRYSPAATVVMAVVVALLFSGAVACHILLTARR